MKHFTFVHLLVGAMLLTILNPQRADAKDPVDYVDPHIGGIGYLLVATDPVVRLPQGAIQLTSNPWPEIYDRYLADEVFSFSLRDVVRYGTKTIPSWIMSTTGPLSVEPAGMASHYDHDFETVTPYYSSILLEDYDIVADYTSTDKVAWYRFAFPETKDGHIILGSNAGFTVVNDTTVTGTETLEGKTFYYYATFSKPFRSFGAWSDVETSPGTKTGNGGKISGVWADYSTTQGEMIEVKIGYSEISTDDACANIGKEVGGRSFDALKNNSRELWNESLSRFAVEGGTEEQLTKFYTGIYFCRSAERLMDKMGIRAEGLNEWGRDYAASSKSDLIPAVSSPGGMFPHDNIVSVARLWLRGIRDFDLEKAYQNIKAEFMESTKLPWREGPATVLDRFYLENGFFPSKPLDVEEWVPEVHPFERRQAVTVTLQGAYEAWCVAQVAKALGKTDDYNYFIAHARDYRNVFNPETNFMSPKTEDGKWITPFDPVLSGGQGGRDYFAELNSWCYTWYVSHDIGGLVELMGGRENFVAKLDALFIQQYRTSKYHFLSQFPDQTGLIGNYAQGNEFSRLIPYLYNYAGAPWKTQKQVREIMDVCYGAGPMGVCGDEDTGLMSHWYITSAMGIYEDPEIPSYPVWLIGSPIFEKSTISLDGGKTFVIEARGVSAQNKYVQSALLNGKPLNRAWFDHSELTRGGTLVLEMGPRPNKQWGSSPDAVPPSMISME